MVIDDPAAAIAASRCVTARSLARPGQPPVTSQHPRRCAWDDYPLPVLSRMVEGFNAWAGAKDQGQGFVYERHDVRVFAELPRDEQERQVVAAQGLDEEGVGGLDPQGLPLAEDRVAAMKQVGQVQTFASEPPEPATEALPPATADEELAAWT